MPGSTDRIQIDVRCDAPERQRLQEVLSAIRQIELDSGERVEVVILSQEPTHNEGHPLVVIGPEDEATMLAAVEDGALGYVISSASIEDMQAVFETVATGVAVIPPMMLGSLLRHTVRRRQAVEEVEERLAVLTDREREVVHQLSLAKQRREIAQQLFISPETVRTHIQRAMSKLGVHSQTELMALIAPLDRGTK